MARITVEDCLENVDNRFELVMVTAHRAKKLLKKTAQPLVQDHRENREVVTALREIADGSIRAVKVAEIDLPEIDTDAEEAAALVSIPVDAEQMS